MVDFLSTSLFLIKVCSTNCTMEGSALREGAYVIAAYIGVFYVGTLGQAITQKRLLFAYKARGERVSPYVVQLDWLVSSSDSSCHLTQWHPHLRRPCILCRWRYIYSCGNETPVALWKFRGLSFLQRFDFGFVFTGRFRA